MTLEEKREAIELHCEMCYGCDFCPVYPVVKGTSQNCHSEGADIERNYNLIFGGCEPTTEPEKSCGNCHHILCAAFDYPCAECWDKNKWEPKEEKQNPYWERITAIAEKRRAKGMSKENNTANATERVRHIQEELIDALMYLTWLEESLKEGGADDQD